MLFQRRAPPRLVERLRVALWPRRSWLRSARYVWLRLGRLEANPHAVGLGLAAGAFAAFLPLIGLQMAIAGLIAWFGRASVAAALLGTFAGNPLTWPMIWLVSYKLGVALLGLGEAATAAEIGAAISRLSEASGPTLPERIEASGAILGPVLIPLATGAVALGLTAALILYYIVRKAAEARIGLR
jgi:hypothetical protein